MTRLWADRILSVCGTLCSAGLVAVAWGPCREVPGALMLGGGLVMVTVAYAAWTVELWCFGRSS